MHKIPITTYNTLVPLSALTHCILVIWLTGLPPTSMTSSPSAILPHDVLARPAAESGLQLWMNKRRTGSSDRDPPMNLKKLKKKL